jgi:serine/threonine protein kinase, bacterial
MANILIVAGQAAVDGTPFGRYRLVELLGRGGMGEVWRAYDTVTKRTTAIKVLPAQLGHDDEFAYRFRREAEAAARLNSPHVIPIYDYGEIEGRLFVCMRLIEGHDLQTVLGQGPLEPARAVHIIEQVAKALHAAHRVGLIHRDVKPSNILLDEDEFAYLIDFGIARAADETRLTKSGNTIGTFAYIAPERLDGRANEDARVDIYSLACVLYETLTGEPPFAGDTTPRLIAAHLTAPPPRPSITRPEVPAPVDEVIATGMAKDPDQRYATTVELAGAVRKAITEPIPRAAPTGVQPPTEPAPTPAPVWQQPAPVWQQPAPVWQQPALRIPTRAGGISRRTTIALIAVAIALVAVIAAALSIPDLVKHRPSESAQTVLPFTGLNGPWGAAVDSTGTLYVTDSLNNRVLKLSAGSSTPTVLPFTGLNGPQGVAVDSTGALYVTDYDNNRVLKLSAGSSTPTVLPFTGLSTPADVAVDSTGTLYVTDYDNNRVLKLSAGSNTQSVLPFTGLLGPWGVAVDSAGALYVTDTGNNRVLKLAAGSATAIVLPFNGLDRPGAVAAGADGAVYVADTGNNRVLKLAG